MNLKKRLLSGHIIISPEMTQPHKQFVFSHPAVIQMRFSVFPGIKELEARFWKQGLCIFFDACYVLHFNSYLLSGLLGETSSSASPCIEAIQLPDFVKHL